MPNRPPVINLRDQWNVLANEQFWLKNLVDAQDPDGDEIIRYRIYSASSAEGVRQGYFMLDGNKLEVGKGHSITNKLL